VPEGPEVKRFGKDLASAVSGKELLSVKILSGRYTKKPLMGLSDLNVKLPAKVIGIGVHGKFLYWILDNEFFLYSSLGMTGHWGNSPLKHSRVSLTLRDCPTVYYTDQRNFGTLKFVYGRYQLQKKLESLGPDMLSEDVSHVKFRNRILRKKDWSIAKAIMDQSVIAGVGNYVKAEALWRVKLSPHRKVSSLEDIEINSLNESIKDVLRDSYTSGGATIRSYRTFDGTEGRYTRRFAVYNQKKDPKGFEVIRETTTDGRTTHWVPQVQK
jgi:DNA-formamidopyrimidine glycosylase